jgi:predicted nucleotidyltransferase
MPPGVKEVTQIKEEIASVLSEENVAAVYLFGSLVDGYEIPSSDIDLAVLFKDTHDFKQELELGAKLELNQKLASK